MNTHCRRKENKVAGEFDERQCIYLHECAVESVQALEPQREILAHEAAEEIIRRGTFSLGMMRSLEFESHSEAPSQREGFGQTQYYLQKCLISSNEECRKYYHLYEEFQHETASMMPDVGRVHARDRQLTSEISESQHRETEYKGQRQNFEREIARLEVGRNFKSLKQDLEVIRLTNDSKSQRNTEFIRGKDKATRSHGSKKRSAVSAFFDEGSPHHSTKLGR